MNDLTNGAEPVRFDTKIAVLLREDLEPWQRLNVTAFLVSGLGSQVPEVIGEPYEDADGVGYLPMFRQPVLVFQGTKETLDRRPRARAVPLPAPGPVHLRPLHHGQRPRQPRGGPRRADRGTGPGGPSAYGPKNAVDKVSRAHGCTLRHSQAALT
ncbi:hypothetical protein SFUMM280S_10885 [Streptomyces fumanus]